MKKFLIAAAASFIIFSGQADAAPADDLNVSEIETQDVKSHGKWAHFRDKYILDRETENERRDRKEWERNHRYGPTPPHNRDRYRDYPPPPPPHYRGGHRDYPPPPPPPPGRGYYPPPPPPHYRDGHRDYPPPPPTRYR